MVRASRARRSLPYAIICQGSRVVQQCEFSIVPATNCAALQPMEKQIKTKEEDGEEEKSNNLIRQHFPLADCTR